VEEIMVEFRILKKQDIETIWRDIDRRELVESIYRLKDGKLVLERIDFDVQGWPPGEKEKYGPILEDCFDRGGLFYGAFSGEKLVGVVVLESEFIGADSDQLQLKFLHISRDFRKKGLGRKLFELAVAGAKEKGARALYVSSCESKNSVDFWMHLGCVVTPDVDEELRRLEPEDIHLVYPL
jgi:predicted N-acetyltransferase YhbS